MSTTSESSQLSYNERIIAVKQTAGTRVVAESRNNNQTQSANSSQSSEETRESSGSSSRNRQATVDSSSNDETNTTGQAVTTTESNRNFSNVSQQIAKSSARANIGCTISFSVKIRGGFPTLSNSSASC
ncbi:MAG: hypothetical protein QM627_00025 [Luteolibacter sp.]